MEEKAKIIRFRKRQTAAFERRRFARINEPVEATVKGTDSAGKAFIHKAILANISAGGLSLQIPHQVHAGDRMDFVVRLCLAGRPGVRAPVIAAQGLVRRAERQSDGLCAVAAEFIDHRFI